MKYNMYIFVSMRQHTWVKLLQNHKTTWILADEKFGGSQQ